jgi:hypothetical protein
MSMGIYIKGMEMPQKIEQGLVVKFAVGIDGKRYARLYHYLYGSLTDWLEAVPVPPHGRLVDADVLRKNMAEDYYTPRALSHIDDTPTIIPAEEGEEE